MSMGNTVIQRRYWVSSGYDDKYIYYTPIYYYPKLFRIWKYHLFTIFQYTITLEGKLLLFKVPVIKYYVHFTYLFNKTKRMT